MKLHIFIVLAVLLARTANAQSVVVILPKYRVSAQYTQEFVLDGYVRVREWELVGDKMALRDLGMNTYSALQIRAGKELREKGNVSIIYDQYFMRGRATFDRDIVYNGTIIDGRSGISVSPTRYYRISVIYNHNLIAAKEFELSGLGGLVFDHIVFYLDGKVAPLSPKNEVYEGFGRQAFPYPFIGFSGRYSVCKRGSIFAETSGTYIPEFKSFYTEGGNVQLQYRNVLADVKYSYRLSELEFALGAKLRHMRLFQESREDTNDLMMLTVGPYVELSFYF